MSHLTCAVAPDCASEALRSRIRGAERSLLVAVYTLGAGWAEELVRAAARGVRVQVLLDDHVGGGAALARLRRRAVEVRAIAELRGLGHWKLVVVDGRTTAVATGNLDQRNLPLPAGRTRILPGTREWLVIVGSAPSLAGRARLAFQEAWATAAVLEPRLPAVGRSVAPPVNVPRPLLRGAELEVTSRRLKAAFSAREVAALWRSLLDGAQRRAWVTVPYIDAAAEPVALLGALRRAAGRGCDARLLLGMAREHSLPALEGGGVSVRVMDPIALTTGHAKGLVTDDAALVASSNWSRSGLRTGLEAGIAVSDAGVAAYFGSVFEHDWKRSSAVAGAGVGAVKARVS